MRKPYSVFAIVPLALLLVLASCKSTKPVTDQPDVNAESNRQISRLESEVEKLRRMLGEKENQINAVAAENDQLRTELISTQAQVRDLTTEVQETSDDYGVWFRVQIGAYQDRRIDKDLETTKNISLEERDALQKIALGRFRNYVDAVKLKNQLVEMGLKDAWVVSYKDGERVPIDQVKN